MIVSFSVKPTVVSAPQRQIQINVGQTLTIQCTARGIPAPYINWRFNFAHVCGDGSDNGRCTMTQTRDENDPNLISGTLTIRNVTVADDGAYSCETSNNQGFVFAISDAIVKVISGLYFILMHKKRIIFYFLSGQIIDQHVYHHAIVMVIHRIVRLMDGAKYVLLLHLWTFYIIVFFFRIANIIPLVSVANPVLQVIKVMLAEVRHMIVNQINLQLHLHHVNIYSF